MADDRHSGLGSKLGPRLAQLMAQATISTKQGLMDTEHRLRVNSTRTVVDWMGLEMAGIMGPLLDPVLKRNVLPPNVQQVLQNITSGKNQWQALAGVAFGASGAPALLSTIVSNYLAPVVYDTVAVDPLLIPDVGTLAQIAARTTLDMPRAQRAAHSLGYRDTYFLAMVEAARPYPDLATLLMLWQRGLATGGRVQDALRKSGYPEYWAELLPSLKDVLLSPPDLALAALRGNMSRGEAAAVAHKQGVSAEDFGILVDNTGEPPAVEEMLSLWRRGKISEDRLNTAIRQSRVRTEWTDEIKLLGVIPPSPADALNALLQGQISEGEARRRYEEGGGDPSWFQDAFNSGGTAPTPTELGVMANRGIIPWTGSGPNAVTFEQGFKEGPWRNKWLAPMRKAAEYFPPPRTVTALLNEGAITTDEAQRMLQQQGLSAELAKAYTTESSHKKTAKHRDLAVTQIETLYRDQAIDHAMAAGMLVDLGFDSSEADFILTIADLARVTKFTESAINTVHTQYINHKIDRSIASGQLDVLQVPAAQREDLLALWDLERQTKQQVLTQAQVHSAFKKGIIDQASAMLRLTQLGYTDEDAAILLQL